MKLTPRERRDGEPKISFGNLSANESAGFQAIATAHDIWRNGQRAYRTAEFLLETE